MRFDKKTIRILLEFIFIFSIFVLPPILNTGNFTLPSKPEGFFNILAFMGKIVFLASYEEILYRIYLPFRIKSFYGENSGFFKSCFLSSEVFPILCFAFAHRYMGSFNVLYAMAAGIIFRLLYIIIKKNIESKREKKTAFIAAALCIILIHSFHNGIVYFFIFRN